MYTLSKIIRVLGLLGTGVSCLKLFSGLTYLVPGTRLCIDKEIEREKMREIVRKRERETETDKERERGSLYDSMCNNQSRRLKFIKGLNCQRHFSIWKAEAAFHRKFGTNYA